MNISQAYQLFRFYSIYSSSWIILVSGFLRQNLAAVTSNRQRSCRDHNMSNINHTLASVQSHSSLLTWQGRTEKQMISKNSALSVRSEQSCLTCLDVRVFSSFGLGVWVRVRSQTTPRTGTDESARLQPCSVRCIVGFQSGSLSALARSLSSSLAQC